MGIDNLLKFGYCVKGDQSICFDKHNMVYNDKQVYLRKLMDNESLGKQIIAVLINIKTSM